LRALSGGIAITDAVEAEVLVGGAKPGEAAIAAAIESGWIRVIADE